MKIGDTIYYRSEHGRLFAEKIVVGETSRSWLVKSTDCKYDWVDPDKIPKNGKGYVLGTKQEADLWFWAVENQWKVASKVQYTFDAEKLVQVAKLYGYEPLPVHKTDTE